MLLPNATEQLLRRDGGATSAVLPLYDRSLFDELDGLDEIKAIDIKFALARAEQVSALSQKGMLGGLYKIGKDLNAATVSTRVSVGQSRKTFLKSGVQDEVTELFRRSTCTTWPSFTALIAA